ncbi:MAG TPA: hypothetical protein VGC18_03555 [Lacisediminihabitans sp.]|uniref:hypothetical protein n=1 Tax=Lacisediminihabitans sp. TaxID=2787631 RepID=UPI002EDA70A3
MRKYIFNGSLISAVFGGWSVLRTQRKGPRDWRLVLMWVSWGASVAIAVGNVIKASQDAQREEELEALEDTK